MPIYEYLCDKCEREFEVEQRITDDPIRSCPHCRSRKVRRLISQTSFVLKGSGWYADLYSSSKGKSEGDSKDKGGEAKPAADGAASTASASGDAKSASTSKDSTSPDPGGKGTGGGKGKKKSVAKAAA